MGTERASALPSHVLMFPLPIQGPVKCMLKLAELFCINGLQVTFLNSQHIQRCLLNCSTNVESYFQRYPNFRFETVPDGLPEDNPRAANEFFEMLDSLKAVGVPLVQEMVTSGPYGPNSENPITSIVAEGVFCFAVDIAKKIGVPLFYFDTISPCGLWTYLRLPKLIESGEFPFKGDNLDALAVNAPGNEGFLRRRDLPGFFRTKDLNDPNIKSALEENRDLPLAQGLIFNTFEELDASILSEMSKICPKIYAVGPLHTHVKTRIGTGTTSNSIIMKEDRSCIPWLDKQPLKSVLFVSIGSLAFMTKDQLMEIWHGLVNSGTRFLWVRRPGSVVGLEKEFEISMDLSQATKERGYIVSWAPQEEVLAHPAIGGFFTHSGWNSTLESIVEGKPMICWPHYVDQQVNSRYVGEFWKLGLDMKDTCDRVTVQGMIKEVMDSKKEEFLERADKIANLAKASVSKGGSSCKNLDQLIQDVKLMTFSTLQQG